MAGQITSAVEQLIGEGGRLGNAISSSESRMERLNDRFATTESRIAHTVERYRAQFAAMDSMVGQMNQTSAYLTQQLATLGQTGQ